MLTKTKSCSV